jgi:NitT/TauT family transport system permease protein
MADISYKLDDAKPTLAATVPRGLVLAVVALIVAGIAIFTALNFRDQPLDAPLIADSTPGKLAVWVADQANRGDPVSWLAQLALRWAESRGEEQVDETALMKTVRGGLVAWHGMIALLAAVSAVGLIMQAGWSRVTLTLTMLALAAMIFVIPTMRDDSTLTLVLAGVLLTILALVFSLRHVSKVIGFFLVLAGLLVGWQAVKAFSSSVGYRITVPAQSWDYTTYPTLEDSLAALQAGEIDALLTERRETDGLVLALGADSDAPVPYPGLRSTESVAGSDPFLLGLPVTPAFPGRLAVVMQAEDAEAGVTFDALLGGRVGAVAGDFADERFLAVPRELVLVNLRIFNDLNLPHLQSISEALFQPARRNGPVLLVAILIEAGLYTWGEAAFGFALGATFGFLLGTTLAHSRLLQRGLLPYVVASQTVPILAIAPMVVIWLGAGPLAVAVIASYLTFFPVTINTLRGLQSPDPTAIELMESYAASPRQILFKLRLPAALPYIFTALKISATASVVGAIIGELPSSVRSGLGRAILDFSSDYSVISTPKLWAAILIAALVGIAFFLIVNLVEFIVLRGRFRNVG